VVGGVVGVVVVVVVVVHPLMEFVGVKFDLGFVINKNYF
jgi:hypothetical protein